MYNERNERFSLRDVVLQLLFVALFVFILFWLFPTKNYLDQKIDSLYVDNFGANVELMKDAAKDYFTTARLPQEEGKTVRITLAEMLELKLLLPFTDKNGEQCDLTKSYVEVTKMKDEYIMKVNLKCAGMEDYIIVHMGCYDYCLTDICEVDPTKKPTTPTKPTKPTNPTKPTTTTYLYQYKKQVEKKTETWGAWSAWSKTSINATSLRQVETKQEVEIQKVFEDQLVGTRYLNVTESQRVKVSETFVCTSYSTSSSLTTTWSKVEDNKLISGIPTNTSNTIYVLVDVPDEQYKCDDNSCIALSGYYDVYKSSTVGTSGTAKCTSYRIDPIYVTKNVSVLKTINLYGPVQVDKNVTVTYYRYRDAQVTTKLETVEKWSTSKTDKTLTADGYKYTGVSKKK